MVLFFDKSTCNENTYPKGRALMHMYRVVSITKRESSHVGFTRRVYPVLCTLLTLA